MKCRNCGVELSPNARFCNSCGFEVVYIHDEGVFCKYCGCQLNGDENICPNCGSRLTENDSSNSFNDYLDYSSSDRDAKKTRNRSVSRSNRTDGLFSDVVENAKNEINSRIDHTRNNVVSSLDDVKNNIKDSIIATKKNKVPIIIAAAIALVVLLFIVFNGSKSFSKNSDVDRVSVPCQLYLDIESENNLLFNTYAMDIYYDDELQGTVANGDTFTKLISTETGRHELRFRNSEDHSTTAYRNIDLTGDSTYRCTVSHGKNISFETYDLLDGIIGNNLIVPNVVGMIYDEAVEELNRLGFSNYRYDEASNIWDNSNWIVLSQSVDPGDGVDKNTEIVLTCKHLDDYFNETFTGKSLLEAQKIAEEAGFTIKYIDENNSDITDQMNGLEDNLKENRFVLTARQYSGADRTALLTVFSKNEDAPAIMAPPEKEDYTGTSETGVVLPQSGTKLEMDYDSESNGIIMYINVDGIKNIPELSNWESAIVPDGVAEYLDYLKSLGFSVAITNTDYSEPFSGLHLYNTTFSVTGSDVTWTMLCAVQDEDWVEYELDIILPQ